MSLSSIAVAALYFVWRPSDTLLLHFCMNLLIQLPGSGFTR